MCLCEGAHAEYLMLHYFAIPSVWRHALSFHLKNTGSPHIQRIKEESILKCLVRLPEFSHMIQD